MVSDSLVLHFDANLSFLLCFKAFKKTPNAEPLNMVVEFRLDLLWGTQLMTKTMPRSAYCSELIAIGGQGCPGKLFLLISIGFH